MKKNDSRKPDDLDEIMKVYKLMVKENLTEINWDQGKRKLLIKRKSSRQGPVVAGSPAEMTQNVQPADNAADIEKEQEEKKGTVKIESPMNGVIYRSPSPGDEPFVKEGDVVSSGQTICIIEAMKLMNEIKAECACKIVKIYAADAESVNSGQPIFLILPK